MIVVTFQSEHGLHLGVKKGSVVLDVTSAAKSLDASFPATPGELYREGFAAMERLRYLIGRWAELDRFHLDEADLRLGPATPEPGKIVCVGLNYRQHAAESGMAEPAEPVLFSKFTNSIAAHGDEVGVGGLKEVDYEAELAVVIGMRGKNISEADALSHVLGYTNANDLSERRLQFVSGQWLLGKTLDRFLPIGPHLVTADEVGDPQSMPIRCWVNDDVRQDSTTADMIFSVKEIVSYASRYMTLEPGDLITTGTPEGVAMGASNPDWLKPGDRVVVEVGDLGRLSNGMVEKVAS